MENMVDWSQTRLIFLRFLGSFLRLFGIWFFDVFWGWILAGPRSGSCLVLRLRGWRCTWPRWSADLGMGEMHRPAWCFAPRFDTETNRDKINKTIQNSNLICQGETWKNKTNNQLHYDSFKFNMFCFFSILLHWQRNDRDRLMAAWLRVEGLFLLLLAALPFESPLLVAYAPRLLQGALASLADLAAAPGSRMRHGSGVLKKKVKDWWTVEVVNVFACSEFA